MIPDTHFFLTIKNTGNNQKTAVNCVVSGYKIA
jgi:hypothetical protein